MIGQITIGVILTALASMSIAQVPATFVLEAGTPVLLSTLADVTSKTHRQGDRFDLEVSDDVTVAGRVVIPKGARALGEVTRHALKGPYGKAGKLEIRLLHVTAGGRNIRLDGVARHNGASAAVPAVASTVIVSGLIGMFVSGKNGAAPAGTGITGYVHRDLPLVMSDND